MNLRQFKADRKTFEAQIAKNIIPTDWEKTLTDCAVCGFMPAPFKNGPCLWCADKKESLHMPNKAQHESLVNWAIVLTEE